MKIRLLTALALIVLSPVAAAQCPNGIPSGGNPGCVPPDVYYGSQPNSDPPPLPKERWKTRWGAIAIGSTQSGGGLGFSSKMDSKRQAEKAALKMCRDTGGGKECAVQVTYHNQCGVIAWGDIFFATARASTEQEASQLALKACSEKSEGCKVFYSNCSYPAKIY